MLGWGRSRGKLPPRARGDEKCGGKFRPFTDRDHYMGGNLYQRWRYNDMAKRTGAR